MKIHISIVLSLCLLPYTTNAQFKNDTQAALYDVGFGIVASSVGALINKTKKEKVGKVLLKSLWQGALGGYTIFESKRMLRLNSRQNTYAYYWPSKLINSAGNSILENAAANRNFWETYHINFAFNRFEFDFTKEKKFRYKIMPLALYATIENFLVSDKLVVDKSLKIGTLVFESKGNFGAYARTNQIVYNPDYAKFLVYNHEIVHTYQYEQFSSFNPLFNKYKEKLKKKYSFLNTYTKYFYSDFNQVLFDSLYSLNNNHQTNFFEDEARHYE